MFAKVKLHNQNSKSILQVCTFVTYHNYFLFLRKYILQLSHSALHQSSTPARRRPSPSCHSLFPFPFPRRLAPMATHLGPESSPEGIGCGRTGAVGMPVATLPTLRNVRMEQVRYGLFSFWHRAWVWLGFSSFDHWLRVLKISSTALCKIARRI
jgi:hypothetical protein